MGRGLAAGDAQGELYLVGGAVMCLALGARHVLREGSLNGLWAGSSGPAASHATGAVRDR
jgi:hypothetical protein